MVLFFMLLFLRSVVFIWWFEPKLNLKIYIKILYINVICSPSEPVMMMMMNSSSQLLLSQIICLKKGKESDLRLEQTEV